MATDREDLVRVRMDDGGYLTFARADLDAQRKPRAASRSLQRTKPAATPTQRRNPFPTPTPPAPRAPITPTRIEFPMSTTDRTVNAVDGSWARSDGLRNLLRSTLGATDRLTPELRAAAVRSATLGGYARELIRARGGASHDLELLNRALLTLDEQGRDLQHGVSSDATVPQLLVGPIVRFVDTSRPAITVSNRLPLSGGGKHGHGPQFIRSRTTQPTLVDIQAGGEGTVAPSQKFELHGDLVSVEFVGFTIAVSEQFLDNGGDFSLDSISTDLAKSYAARSARLHCAAIESAVTANTVLAVDASAQQVLAALAGALPAFATGAGNVLPDTLFLSTQRLAQLAALADDVQRPVPPALLADSLGVTIVCDPAFSSPFMALAAAGYLEHYEPPMSDIVTVGVPSTVELNLSYSASVASYVPAAALHGFTVS